MNDKLYDRINPDLLTESPSEQKIYWKLVVEVVPGQAYKAINPDATYMGIELMETPANIARKRLDHVGILM